MPPTLVTLNECPGPLGASVHQSLAGGGNAAGMRWLYPYDGTVFPVGLPAPEMQWEQSGNADAVYVRMRSSLFDYTGCFGANPARRLALPANIWALAGEQGQGGSDPVTVELTVMSGGTVMGPITSTWTIAQGKLQGVLFYNTYTSPQAGDNGAVMRLRLGDLQPSVFLTEPPITPASIIPTGPCWSCHSLSASGTMLVAQRHQYPGGPYSSASFDLAANPNPTPTSRTVSIDGLVNEMGLGAVYPDGSKVLTMGSPGNSSGFLLFPDAIGNVPGMLGPKPSKLLNTRTGAEIPMTGWTVQYAQMPSFSPDGSMVAFNWYDNGQGHSLAVANFDGATNTVSNVRVVYQNATLFPGWPWITPDNKEVVFVLGNTPDYVSSYPSRLTLAQSDLWTVDIATQQARPLNRANGYGAGGGATYLPRPTRDEHLTYFPTMSPVASGGYFWVFFTSRRTYGNIITQPGEQAITKKIWVSAVNIRAGDAAPIADPSHPPFYLPGQEEAAGNIRAFAALEPCRQDGNACDTGIDCCGGHCYNGTCGLPPPPPPMCNAPPPPECYQIDERCNTASDCCDTEAFCIGGYCTLIEPPM